jgi:hypothetical protein
MRRVAAALVHFPVLDRDGTTVTSAITNLDLHDLARSAYCYGLSDLFVTHPIAAQRELACRVRTHWTEGSGARRIPDRKPALSLLRVVSCLEQVLEILGGPSEVSLWVTSARAASEPLLDYERARQCLRSHGPTVLIAFGTGWGLAAPVTQMAESRLAPIGSPRADGFNHLSVRAAAAIVFDRLLAPRTAR